MKIDRRTMMKGAAATAAIATMGGSAMAASGAEKGMDLVAATAFAKKCAEFGILAPGLSINTWNADADYPVRFVRVTLNVPAGPGALREPVCVDFAQRNISGGGAIINAVNVGFPPGFRWKESGAFAQSGARAENFGESVAKTILLQKNAAAA